MSLSERLWNKPQITELNKKLKDREPLHPQEIKALKTDAKRSFKLLAGSCFVAGLNCFLLMQNTSDKAQAVILGACISIPLGMIHTTVIASKDLDYKLDVLERRQKETPGVE